MEDKGNSKPDYIQMLLTTTKELCFVAGQIKM